jgi:hypothetical protein
MMASEAAANGAELIDWYTASIGHDACKPPVIRWVEPVVPVNAAAPVQPEPGRDDRSLGAADGGAYALGRLQRTW